MVSLTPCVNDGRYWPVDTKYLVIVHQYDGDVSWARDLKFPHIIYEKEDKSTNEPFIAVNLAKAETNTLKFIAQFYDHLPANIIQVYQYNTKYYHTGTLVDLLNDEKFDEKYQQSLTPGFLNFNDVFLGDVKTSIDVVGHMTTSGWWPEAMASIFGDISGYGNFTRGKKACAQFVVSRKRIQSLPQSWYANMYEWLATKTIKDKAVPPVDPASKTRHFAPDDAHPRGGWYTSRYMEWTWELIFTSMKKTEDITMKVITPPDSKPAIVSACYGAGLYWRDVTGVVLSRWYLNGNIIVIPGSIKMNEFFSDTVFGSVKTLRITINGVITDITEGNTDDICLSLGV